MKAHYRLGSCLTVKFSSLNPMSSDDDEKLYGLLQVATPCDTLYAAGIEDERQLVIQEMPDARKKKGLVERRVPDAELDRIQDPSKGFFKFQISHGFCSSRNRWLQLFELKYTVVSFSFSVSVSLMFILVRYR
jgi:hypothetical protein